MISFFVNDLNIRMSNVLSILRILKFFEGQTTNFDVLTALCKT